MKKIILVICVCLTFFLISGSSVQAGSDAYVSGKVSVKVDGRSIPIPGVVVYREDVSQWKTNTGTFSVTDSTGQYSFSDTGAIGSKSCAKNGSNATCGAIVPGQDPGQSVCPSNTNHYHCGFSCNPRYTPHHWLAYFPYGFNKSVLPPGVSFSDNDIKGGGSWKAESSSSGGVVLVSPGGSAWPLKTITGVDVTYQSNEWYKSDTTNNAEGISNINIEWVPGQNSISCTGLQKNVSTIKSGDNVVFTCSSLLTGFTFSHYEYRIHTPAQPTDTASTDYWIIPTGWDNLQGATTEYQVPANGGYQVQCRACANEEINANHDKCTVWGQGK
jgi:hypothetical protein